MRRTNRDFESRWEDSNDKRILSVPSFWWAVLMLDGSDDRNAVPSFWSAVLSMTRKQHDCRSVAFLLPGWFCFYWFHQNSVMPSHKSAWRRSIFVICIIQSDTENNAAFINSGEKKKSRRIIILTWLDGASYFKCPGTPKTENRGNVVGFFFHPEDKFVREFGRLLASQTPLHPIIIIFW